jgi:hypothetical protein
MARRIAPGDLDHAESMLQKERAEPRVRRL